MIGAYVAEDFLGMAVRIAIVRHAAEDGLARRSILRQLT
jgi:hypothetical protein